MIQSKIPKLRDYQDRCVAQAMQYLEDKKDKKPGLIIAPTAAGKSLIIAAIADKYKDPLLVLQPSIELLEQNHSKLCSYGYIAEIYSASAKQKTFGHITFATLGSIKDMAQIFKDLGVKTVIIDEAHDGYPPERGSMFRAFMDELGPDKVIGLTATPYYLRGGMDGSELKLMTRIKGAYFKRFLDIIQIPELTSQGYWAPLQYELHEFNEDGLEINTSGSDYTEESLKQAVKVQGINNNIYKRILKLQEQNAGSILVFLDSVENAQKMAELAKIKDATWISGKMPKKQRKERVDGFRNGKYSVMCVMGTLTTGFDYPDLRNVIIGRPTMSLAKYYQIIGRGTRPSPATDKASCRIIDYCNNVLRFGRVEDLLLEEIPGWGHGVFNGEVLLTNTPISGATVTKEDIVNRINGKLPVGDLNLVVWFGIHKGKKVCDVPINWVKWLFSDQANFNWGHPKMMKLKHALEAYVKLSEEKSLRRKMLEMFMFVKD
jgi:DNA repair protein RadD